MPNYLLNVDAPKAARPLAITLGIQIKEKVLLPEFKRKTNLGVGIGIIIQIVGRVLVNTRESALAWLGFVIALAGLALFIWGCGQYAKAKGHSGWFGGIGRS